MQQVRKVNLFKTSVLCSFDDRIKKISTSFNKINYARAWDKEFFTIPCKKSLIPNRKLTILHLLSRAVHKKLFYTLVPKMNFYALANETRDFINDCIDLEKWYFLHGIIKIKNNTTLVCRKAGIVR